MEKLLNVENEWSDRIDASKVESTVRRLKVEEVQCATNLMKIQKARGPSWVAIAIEIEKNSIAIELFKAGVDKYYKSLTKVFNILFKDRLPDKWMLSLLI